MPNGKYLFSIVHIQYLSQHAVSPQYNILLLRASGELFMLQHIMNAESFQPFNSFQCQVVQVLYVPVKC